MKSYLLSLCAIVLLTSVISLILPSKRTKTVIKSTFSLIIMLCIIKPVLTLIKGNFNYNDILQENYMDLQGDYIGYVNSLKSSYYKDTCIQILQDIGITKSSVEIEYQEDNNNLKINNIKIFLNNAVIISDKEHIDIIEDIQNRISSFLRIDKKAVIIYE